MESYRPFIVVEPADDDDDDDDDDEDDADVAWVDNSSDDDS